MKKIMLLLSLIVGMKSIANNDMNSFIEATRNKIENFSTVYSDKANEVRRDLPLLSTPEYFALSREKKADILDRIEVEEWNIRALRDRFEKRYEETGCTSVESRSCKELFESLQEFKRITDELLSDYEKARSIIEQPQTR